MSTLLMAVSVIGAFLDDPQWKVQEDLDRQTKAADQRSLNPDDSQPKRSFNATLKTFVDFSHFKDRNFALLGATTFFIYALYNTAIYFLAELMKSFDYTESQSAKFISLIGLFLMLGMLVLGWLADKKFTNVVVLNGSCVLRE